MRLGNNQLRWCGLVVGMLLFGSVLPAYAADNAVTLRYKFKNGEVLPYVMQQKMDMNVTAGGRDITMKSTMGMNMAWHITKVEDNGSAQIKQDIKHISFTMEGGPLAKIEYDSKTHKQLEGPLASIATIFNAMAGSSFTFTMSPQGKISDFTVPEKLTDAFKGSLGGQGAPFSPDQLKQMVQQSYLLPEKPVSKGDSWDQKLNVNMGAIGSMTGKNVMTYDGAVAHNGQQLQKISLKPDIAIKPKADSPVKFEMKNQKGDGTILFDERAGRIAEMHMVQSMTMATSVGGQDINQKIKQTVTMKLDQKK